jgi:hypothetical protein
MAVPLGMAMQRNSLMAVARCTLIAIGLAALHTMAAWAEEPVRLRALQSCPAQTDGGACVEMTMHWDFARTDRPRFVAGGEQGARVIAVRGRLNEGPARGFELALAPVDGAGEDHLGEVAYLGRSRAWQPVIATDQGALAIETRGIHVGRSQGVTIIDERTGKIAASYLSGLSGGTYIVRGPDDAVVVSKSGACVSPLPARVGVLVLARGCEREAAPLAGFAFSERIAGAIKPAHDADLGLIRKLLPQTSDLSDEQLRAKVGRVGDHHLVVTPWKD